MRILRVVGIAILLCGAAAAQTCISYVPAPATFPFPLAVTNHDTFTFTYPNGSVSTSSLSSPGTTFFDSPRNQATAVFGASSGSLFQACNNVFPSRVGSATFLNTSVPQKYQVTVTINSSGGSMSITEDAINTVINADGACPRNCSFDNLHIVKSYQYNIATGAYTINLQASRHFLGIDPTTGIQLEQVGQNQGSASGVWPVNISSANSKFITIDYPGQGNSTLVLGINNLGVMVGTYADASGAVHAFMLNSGIFTNIDATALGATLTQAWGINDNDDVVGFYLDAANRAHGFLRQSNGTYSVLDHPGATTTFASGINDLGQIVGSYFDSTSHLNGFLLSNGVYSTIAYPQAVGTDVTRINDSGTLIGNYADASATQHGFQIQNGVPSTLDPPTSTLTEPWGINDGGQVVGGFVPGASHIVGFELSNGSYQTIDFPAAVKALVVYDINNQGQQAGTYVDANGVGHGFVSARGPFLYATNPAGNNLLVIDSAVNLQLAAIPVGPNTGFLAASPDQTQLYMTSGNQVDVVDTASNTIVQTIPVGNNAVGVAVSPSGASAYVANNADSTVSVIDTVRRTVSTTITGIPRPIDLKISLDGQWLYVTNQGANGSVTVISTATNTVSAVIGGIAHPFTLELSPDGAYVYLTAGTTTSGSVVVISTATNSIVATIPVGNGPINVAFSPDGSTAYVDNQTDSTISIINTATRTVISTIPVGPTGTPGWVVVSPDGSSLYVLDLNAIDAISTTSRSLTASVPASGIWLGTALFLSSPPTTQTLTQPLSPTAPNPFNFGTHNFTVQYPAGTNFTGVNMTVAAAQTTQVGFQQSLAGQFPGASCIVYSGSGGNCVNYQVSCTDSNGNTIPCPSLPTATIDVKTSYDTLQAILNPGFLRLPTGSTQWENIFTAFLLQKIDPTTKGKTKGFSDFVAVDLGASNPQGAATLQMASPLRASDPRVFTRSSEITVRFQLFSLVNPGAYVSDAQAGLSIVMIADANGNAVSHQKLALPPPAFQYSNEHNSYRLELEFEGYPPGTYALTIYGNAFAAQQVLFTVR